MKKIILTIALLIPYVVSAFNIDADEYVVYDRNNSVIIESSGIDDKVYVASLIKMTTLIVAIENIDDMNETVILTDDVFEGLVAANASVAGFKTGQEVTYMDLLMGLQIPSGADAANALAINLFGTEGGFVDAMNEFLVKLNIDSTNYTNPTGLHNDNNYSTVRDILTILNYALSNDTFREVFSTRSYLISDTSITFKATYVNSAINGNIDIDYVLGAKTGFTDQAELCFATLVDLNGNEFIIITTGSEKINSYNHINDNSIIYNELLNNYSYQTLYNKGDILGFVSSIDTESLQYNIIADDEFIVFTNNDYNKNDYTYVFDGVSEVSPRSNGENIGNMNVYKNDVLIHSFTVIVGDDEINYSMFGFVNFYKVEIASVSIGGLVLLLIIIKIFKRKK